MAELTRIDKLSAQLQVAESALREIRDNDYSCLCDHDDDDCCVPASQFCAQCIAAHALRNIAND